MLHAEAQRSGLTSELRHIASRPNPFALSLLVLFGGQASFPHATDSDRGATPGGICDPLNEAGIARTLRDGAQANARRRAEQREWEVAHKGEVFDPQWFVEKVLTVLAVLSLPTIAESTGVSATARHGLRFDD